MAEQYGNLHRCKLVGRLITDPDKFYSVHLCSSSDQSKKKRASPDPKQISSISSFHLGSPDEPLGLEFTLIVRKRS